MYGYRLTREIEDLSGGKLKVTEGALYPALHKMEAEGVLETEFVMVNNRNRKYYKLSPKGNAYAKEKITEVEDFIEMLTNIFILKPRKA